MELLTNPENIIVSGVKPSGDLHLGTLLGAIKPLAKLDNKNNLFVFIADIHALTKPIEAEKVRTYTRDLLDVYLCYLSNKPCYIFKQSQVPAHAQLAQILTCYLDVPDLTKMPQYKAYCDSHKNKAVPAGVLDYVNWMNADILLYSPKPDSNQSLKVLCGQDQLPHIHLCKEVTARFNKRYGDTFKSPEALVAETGAKIMSLVNPTKKMSKSESDNGTIYLLDDIEVSKKKIMRALTDSENKIYFDPENKPGISNLLTIYSCLSDKDINIIVKQYENVKNYGVFKKDLCSLLEKELKFLQEKVKQIRESEVDLEVLEYCNKQVNNITSKKIEEIYQKVGLR